MINSLIELSLRQRFFVVLLALALIGYGVYSTLRLSASAGSFTLKSELEKEGFGGGHGH